MTYDAWGGMQVIGGSQQSLEIPFGFAGGLRDKDTGLIRFGYRDYDPKVGRWTTRDPLGLEDGPNLYTYVGNNPIMFTDPSGLYSASDAANHLGYASTAASALTVICAPCAPVTATIAGVTGMASLAADVFAQNYGGVGESARDIGITQLSETAIQNVLRRRLKLPKDLADRLTIQIINTGETGAGIKDIIDDILKRYQRDPTGLEEALEKALETGNSSCE